MCINLFIKMSPCIAPLHLSSCEGTPEDVQTLDEVIKIDPLALYRLQHSPSFERTLPVMCAAEAGHADCLALLLDRGGNLNSVDRDLRRTMFYAVQSGSAKCVEILASRGAAVDHLSKDGSPTTYYLEQACDRGNADIVRTLLHHGASLAPETKEDLHSPLGIAVTKGHTSCVKWLLFYGSDCSHERLRTNILNIISQRNCKIGYETREEILFIMHELDINLRNWVPFLRKRNMDRLADYLLKLLHNPRTLQSACRVTLRRAFGHEHYMKGLRELHVPPYSRSILDSSLNAYLQYENLK